MCESGQPQVCDANEVGAGAVAARSALGLLQQAVHFLHEGLGMLVGHAPHHGGGMRRQDGGQLPEWLQTAVPCPVDLATQDGFGLSCILADSRFGVDLAQRHLQPPCPRDLEIRVPELVLRVGLRLAPLHRILAHAPYQTIALGRAQFAQRPVRLAPHFVHRLHGQLHEVEAVVTDGRVRQRCTDAFGICGVHIHATCWTWSGSPPCTRKSAMNSVAL